jgi:hypothetical protein
MLRRLKPVLPLALAAIALHAQDTEDTFRVYTDHPRLFLTQQRLRLLTRERERQSMRWMQFETLVQGGVQMPEPGFAFAVYYAITGDPGVGKKAVEYALGRTTDVRQSALVYDWCHDLLTPAQSKTIAARLVAAAGQTTAKDIRAVRTRALAAIAAADELGDRGEAVMRDIIERWWRKQMAPALTQGTDFNPGEETFAVVELLHAIRDNVTIDLRASAGDYFKQLPEFYVSSHYPAPYPAAENEYRIPFYKGSEPDLKSAAMSRAAGLAMVAYDTNAIENQYLQGWLIQDRFLLRGTLGSPYELMWANPYQPGLSYMHLPLAFHDPRSGNLFVRSSWDEDATWFGLYQGEAQVFRDGHITVLRQSGSPQALAPKVAVGDAATIVLGRSGVRFAGETARVFVIGLKPQHAYDVEPDDEEMMETETDKAGTLEIALPPDRETPVRIREKEKEGPGSG